MTDKTALDISVYSGEVSEASFKKAKKEGVSLIIVGLQNVPVARRQIENAVKAGLTVEAYVYLYFARDPLSQVETAINAIKDLPVKRLWLDAEDTEAQVVAKRIDLLQKCRAAVEAAGLQTGIYTATWYWTGYMGNSTAFSDLPLWDAYWDKDPDRDKPTYGGWTAAAMSQHTNDTHFAGIWCDINSYDPLVLTIPDLPPPAGMLDWGPFYTNGAKPVRIERRNPTTLKHVYEVHKFVKG